MRTRIILISLLALVAAGAIAVAAGSGGDEETGAEGGTAPERVAASFYPLAFAASALDPEAEVANLTPPGAEPHDLELSADVVEELQSADLVLLMGRDFQPQLEQAADGASGEVVELLEAPGLDLRASDDPHIWLDPILYAGAAKGIEGALGRPGGLEAFVARLEALDRDYRRGLAVCERRELVTSHDAFGYLADRYGLRQIPITGISPEAEPSPAELRDSIEQVRESGATVVFSEALVSPRLAETVARETGAETRVLSTLEGLEPAEEAEGADYFTEMRSNLALLREALGCR
jgi:zinc transport system substrate-binding protein